METELGKRLMFVRERNGEGSPTFGQKLDDKDRKSG